jgi:putative tricarboxylic transport membrane protein
MARQLLKAAIPAISVSAAGIAAERAAAADALDQVTIMAPAAPGGGWDSTARVMQEVLQAAGIVKSVQVENVAGAGGTRGLVQFVKRKGDPKAWMMSGLVMVGAIVLNKTPMSLTDVTPIARLTAEWQAIAVTPEAKIQSMSDLVAALRANVGAVSWGGGSAGGTDHLTAALLAKAAGADAAKINYVAHSGGGDSLAAILGNHVSLGVNSVSEFMPQVAAGKLKIIGVSSDKPLPGINAPTFKEAGLDIVIANWRGIMGAPDLSASDRATVTEAVDRMVKSAQWKAKLKERGWEENYVSGDAFRQYVAAEQARVSEVMKSIGIAR